MANKENKYIFVTSDYTGKKIVLRTSTFYNHIISGHSEMVDNKLAIQESVERPDFVVESKWNSNSHLYIARCNTSTYPSINLTTVVDHSTEVGFVITSFFHKLIVISEEGRVIYP